MTDFTLLVMMTVWALDLLVNLCLANTGRPAAGLHLPTLDDELLEAGERLLQPLPRHAAARPDGPTHVTAQLAQAQALLQLGRVEGAGQILLVGQHQDGHGVPFRQLGDLEQLKLSLLQPLRVGAVHHEDDAVGAAGVGAPEWAGLVLPAHVPQQEVLPLRSSVTASTPDLKKLSN